MQIAIINYQGGNIGSVFRAMEFIRKDIRKLNIYLANSVDDVKKSDRIIIPGQGAMPQTMSSILSNNISEVISDNFGKKPFLGICVGMQILLDKSEEGNTKGLGLIKGSVVSFKKLFKQSSISKKHLKIPHLGWSKVKISPHPLWDGINHQSDFYFAHSYCCQIDNQDLGIGLTTYGVEFHSAVAGPAYFATQFHPEKSGVDGLKLLRNFIVKDF